jgi:manganese/zinc/iron transport system substrate-binding protein
MRLPLPNLALLTLIAIFLSVRPGSAESIPLRVVTTTALIADAVTALAGDFVSVDSLMGEGVDPHLYKPAPGDVRLLSGADIILFHGLRLEGKMEEILRSLKSRKSVYAVTETIPSEQLLHPEGFTGSPDPHTWFDVSLWRISVDHIAGILSRHLPARSAEIESARKAYTAELHELERTIRARLSVIPQGNRVLVTAHNAFGYFGRAFEFEVRGVQGLSTESEASLRDITTLVDELVTHKVPAVFIESSVPRRAIQALIEGSSSRGHTVRLGGELYSDALGAPRTPESTYVGMMLHNVIVITNALAPESSHILSPTPSLSDSELTR